MACSKHVDSLCDCPAAKKVLKYRYTMSELREMLKKLGARKEAYVTWVARVEAILDSTESAKTEVRILKDLIEEAGEYGFTESRACEELLLTLQDVKKCVSTALQIGCGKHRTRHSTGKCLDASGLREFLEQVEGLPCLVPEAESLWAKLAEVESFQQEAGAILSLLSKPDYNWTDSPDFNLMSLIERGEAFEVYVPEVKELKMALQQTTWINETESKLKGDKPTLETLKSMHKLGCTLLRESAGVERVLETVRDMISAVQDWEQQTKVSLKQKPPQTVEFFTALLESAEAIPALLPSEAIIRDTLEKAKQWGVQAKTIQESASNPQYTALKTLLDAGRSIPVQLDLVAQLESCYTASKAWYDRTSRAFLKKNSTLGLLEVLLPRSKASFFLRYVNKGPRKKTETDFSHYQDPLAGVVGEREKEVAKIHVIEAMEKVYANQIRTENSQKMEHDESGKGAAGSPTLALYCFCQKPESGYMLQCELCLEWYHATCLRLPKNKQTQEKEIDKWSRFLCSFCQRTRRPRLDTIVSLLISLQKVPVTITEGSALQCLAERAVAWQRKARQTIASITITLEAARTQKKRIEEIKGHIRRWRNEAKSDQTSPASSIQAQLASSAGSVLNHYESELERLTVKYAGLTSTRRSSLESLLMEGDLLEVTLDEVQQLWELIQQDSQLLTSFQERGKAIVDEKPMIVEEQDKPRKRGRKEQSPALSTTSTNSVSSDSNKGPSSKKPKRNIRPTPKASPSLTPSGNSKTSLLPTLSALMSSEMTNATSGNRKTREQSTGSVSSSDGLGCNEEVLREEEEESECSAEKCKQPVAKEISWVQCDYCQGWFHCMCVGLTKESAEKIESYNCVNCKDVKPTSSQPASSAKARTQPAPKNSIESLAMEGPVAIRRGIYELARALQNSFATPRS